MMMSIIVFAWTDSAEARSRKPKPDDDDDQDSARGRSAAERQGKTYEAVFELFGAATPLNGGSGLTGGKYLDSDTLVELNIAAASASKTDSSSFSPSPDDFITDDTRTEGTSRLISVRYKQFVNNSFYWYAGGADRMTHATLYDDSDLSGDNLTPIATYDTHDIGVTGAIGNQWQWENFTLGCDWIGFYAPLVKLKNDVSNGSGLTSSNASTRDSFQKALTTTTVQALRFYLGASF
jgi:hypothetical protein